MKRTVSYLLCSTMLLFGAMAVDAQAANREGQFSLSPVIGGITFDGPQHLATRPFYGIRGGYNFTSHLGVEALFDYAHTFRPVVAPMPNSSGTVVNCCTISCPTRNLFPMWPPDMQGSILMNQAASCSRLPGELSITAWVSSTSSPIR